MHSLVKQLWALLFYVVWKLLLLTLNGFSYSFKTWHYHTSISLTYIAIDLCILQTLDKFYWSIDHFRVIIPSWCNCFPNFIFLGVSIFDIIDKKLFLRYVEKRNLCKEGSIDNIQGLNCSNSVFLRSLLLRRDNMAFGQNLGWDFTRFDWFHSPLSSLNGF